MSLFARFPCHRDRGKIPVANRWPLLAECVRAFPQSAGIPVELLILARPLPSPVHWPRPFSFARLQLITRRALGGDEFKNLFASRLIDASCSPCLEDVCVLCGSGQIVFTFATDRAGVFINQSWTLASRKGGRIGTGRSTWRSGVKRIRN